MDKKELTALLCEQFDKCETNSFKALGHAEERIWEKPMIGFAAGDDPLFQFFKDDIGEFYMTPAEIFMTKYPGADVRNEDLTVISLGFSQTAGTKKDQAAQKEEPCMRWMFSRNTWKMVTNELYSHLSEALAAQGMRFAIPDQAPQMKIRRSAKYGLASTWSQRHTAFAAGLGTFSLSEGLITRLGVAMRFASVVIEGKFEPDKREYAKHQEWCLFYKDGSCGVCARRCPADAITKDGHDKDKCDAYLTKMDEKHLKNTVFDPNVEVGCGLCQSGVPCADRMPAKM